MKRCRERIVVKSNSRLLVLEEVYKDAPRFAHAWCEMCSSLDSEGNHARLARTTALGVVLGRALHWFAVSNLQGRYKKLLKKDVYALIVAMVYSDMDDYEAECLCIALKAQGLLKRCKLSRPHDVALEAITKYGMPRHERHQPRSAPSHSETTETDMEFFARVFRVVIEDTIEEDSTCSEGVPLLCDSSTSSTSTNDTVSATVSATVSDVPCSHMFSG